MFKTSIMIYLNNFLYRLVPFFGDRQALRHNTLTTKEIVFKETPCVKCSIELTQNDTKTFSTQKI